MASGGFLFDISCNLPEDHQSGEVVFSHNTCVQTQKAGFKYQSFLSYNGPANVTASHNTISQFIAVSQYIYALGIEIGQPTCNPYDSLTQRVVLENNAVHGIPALDPSETNILRLFVELRSTFNREFELVTRGNTYRDSLNNIRSFKEVFLSHPDSTITVENEIFSNLTSISFITSYQLTSIPLTDANS